MFFVLSGFVLYFGFHHSPRGAGYVSHCFRFFLKRIFRIYPAFLASIVVAVFLVINFNGVVSNGYSNWFSSFWIRIIDLSEVCKTLFLLYPGLDTRLINPVIWTLVVELKVSFLFPVIVLPMVYCRDLRFLLGLTAFFFLTAFFYNPI